jgi:hypothetical protein
MLNIITFKKFLKFTPCKKMQSQHFCWPQARLLPANYEIFEVPVLVFARASGNAVSAVRPWDRGCFQT